ncbi:hypothetical protein [Fischerella sp. PCC 9605]|nr:hypothetical protein [Fischerella sp. PCC 9605]
MIRQLIDEYRDQLTAKKNEIQRLESKIQELEALETELEKNTEENL